MATRVKGDAPDGGKGVRLKLDRAKVHIDALNESVQAWLRSGAYTLVDIPDPRSSDRLIVPKITQELKDEWPLLVGDAVHNMRSALDHLVFSLALNGYRRANPGQSLPEGVENALAFPVISTSGSRTIQEIHDEWDKRHLLWVPPPAVAKIRGLQPLARSPGDPSADPLSIVNRLDNIDKHRRLHAVAIATPTFGVRLTGCL